MAELSLKADAAGDRVLPIVTTVIRANSPDSQG